jgi:hypothetical protein
MSKRGQAKSGKPTAAAASKPAKQAPRPPEVACKPLKPRPKLFAALMIGFAIWLGVLLTLYFKTVYPMRYPSDAAATRPGASALPSAPR